MKGSRPLTAAEIQAVLEILKAGHFPERDQAMFILGFRSGFRISEILSLKISDIVQNGNLVDDIAVARKNMKKKREGRIVPLHSAAKDAVGKLREELRRMGFTDPETFLFKSRTGVNRPLTRQGAWEVLNSAFRKCGLTGKLGTHCMRKTFAKNIYEKLGHDLVETQEALGHKQISSTAVYLSFNKQKIRAAILED